MSILEYFLSPPVTTLLVDLVVEKLFLGPRGGFGLWLDTAGGGDYIAVMSMPVEIKGLGKEKIVFVWDDDTQSEWPARKLRLLCTCAYCKSEVTGERTLDESTVPEVLSVDQMHLVGNYGVNVHFSDGHTTGIYRFSLIKPLDPNA